MNSAGEDRAANALSSRLAEAVSVPEMPARRVGHRALIARTWSFELVRLYHTTANASDLLVHTRPPANVTPCFPSRGTVVHRRRIATQERAHWRLCGDRLCWGYAAACLQPCDGRQLCEKAMARVLPGERRPPAPLDTRAAKSLTGTIV